MTMKASEFVNIDNDLAFYSTFKTIEELVESTINQNKRDDENESEDNRELLQNFSVKLYFVLFSFR